MEVIISPLFDTIFGNLNSLIAKEFGLLLGVNRELEKLSSTLSVIRCVLQDAEDMQIKETAVRDWLRKLKHAAFDAEDILDECQTEALQLESDIANISCSKQVSHSFSTCYDLRAILFRRRMGKKIQLLAEKFEEIANQRKFHLNPAIVESGVEQLRRNRETSSTPIEPIIYGRDGEKETIVETLLNNVSSRSNLSICPVLGLGGLGKTTLAQLVYNDKRITNRFDAKIWICVSEDFGIKRIAKMVLDHLSGNASTLVDLDIIQNQSRRVLHGKKFLLVLDDVWNDSQEHWNQMMLYLLSCGDKGSSVIVTTRLQTVVSSMTRIQTVSSPIIHPTLNLQLLSEHDCWSLFKHYAFNTGSEENQELVELGQEIVRKCRGIPLAVKALGALLHLKNEKFWRIVKDNDIWNLQKHGEHVILPALRLSYNHLPPVRRQCFAFCAVYPKDYPVEKGKLIHYWIANGFIQSNDEMEVEDIGDGIFNELLRRSFFHDLNQGFIKIHDLMHDLACSVMVDECPKMMTGDTNGVPHRVRHMYVESELQLPQNIVQTLSRSHSFLRTIIFINVDFTLVSSFSKLKFLRALDLSGLKNLKKLPLWIGHLKHLRCIDLSLTDIASLSESICCLRNLQILILRLNSRLKVLTPSIGKLMNLRCLDLSCTSIEVLPETICDLTNLRSLNLFNCLRLKHLPKKLGNMKNLRHLNTTSIVGAHHENCMPIGIGLLTCLETLPVFEVSPHENRSEFAGIQELERLNCLKGKLEIYGLHQVDDSSDAQQANLRMKKNLSRLGLGFNSYGRDGELGNSSSSEGKSKFDVLRALEPHPYLQELMVNGYTGKLLPSWVGDSASSLPKLTSLQLINMPNVEGWWPSSFESGEVAPQVHGHAYLHLPLFLTPCLKKLEIRGCPRLKLQELPPSIEELRVGRRNDPTLSWVNTLPHLSSLEISDFHGGLPKKLLQNLAHLHSLYIVECSKLKLSKVFKTVAGKLRKLRIKNCMIEEEDEGIVYRLGSLEKLTIEGCQSLKSLYWWQHLTALQTLKLDYCLNLDISAVGFKHLRALRILEFSSLPQLSCLPEGIQHLTRLKRLKIENCKNLIMLPEWLQQDQLPALEVIFILHCHPELHRRCSRDKGEDRQKISHLLVWNRPE